MTFKVRIEYHTQWGESLVLRVGGARYPLDYCGDGIWEGMILRISPSRLADYGYEVVNADGLVRTEWKAHSIFVPKGQEPRVLSVRDRWNERPDEAPFHTAAFTEVIFRRDTEDSSSKFRSPASLHVVYPAVRPGEVLCVAAGSANMGGWEVMHPLDSSSYPVWTLDIDETRPFEYKFVIADRQTLAPIVWESGQNRIFPACQLENEHFMEASAVPCFPRLPWRGAGTAIPVFSLRSNQGFGTGEFNDLMKLVDWAASTGQKVIQLLPVNDTTMSGTWRDSYPYNPNSTFALHPQYIHLPDAGVAVDDEYLRYKDELNSLDHVDYEKVNRLKLTYLRKAFHSDFPALSEEGAYRNFVKENAGWLIPYSAFCVLRDMNGTADFRKWGEYSKYGRKKIEDFCATHREDCDFWCFVQFHLDRQLSKVCRYAHERGVIFKGDLPIGVSRTSVDAWVHPELFHLDSQAGAPPDAFSAQGQNWGFPTYDWDRMAQDGYAWWKARLGKMAEYFDAFRIDHILGFFRIWRIPVHAESGLEGSFSPAMPYGTDELEAMGLDASDDALFLDDPDRAGFRHPRIDALSSESFHLLPDGDKKVFEDLYNDFYYFRHNDFWRESAMRKLPALLDSTSMLACGEDLGMIPGCVPEVMDSLKILSLEIQRMPKSYGKEFDDPSTYPYLSVCTTSTHDMNPLRAWWEEDRDTTGRFYRQILGADGDAPLSCEPWICRRILQMHLDSPAMLTVLPLQDWLSMDGSLRLADSSSERINIPADPNHYWRYRMHISLEDLCGQRDFNTALSEMIRSSGRTQ